jgi:hypothetical protein
MNKVAIVLAASMLTAGSWSTLASDQGDIVQVLKQWISGEAGTVATCANDAAVIDDVPPFEWHGPGACSRWRTDNDAYARKQGVTDATGTIGDPLQLTISGSRAYVVAPTTWAYTQKGKHLKEIATSTFVLHKTAAGWRITAWTWSTQTIQ